MLLRHRGSAGLGAALVPGTGHEHGSCVCPEAGAEAQVCRACTKPHRNVSVSSGLQQGMWT